MTLSLLTAVNGSPEHLVGMHAASKKALENGILGEIFPQAGSLAADVAQVVSVVLPLLTLTAALISLGIGRYGVAQGHVVGILLSHVWPLEPFWSETERRVVELVRLPRILQPQRTWQDYTLKVPARLTPTQGGRHLPR